MSVLRTIEQKIEGLFEGVFGRAFRTHVQPVELARKLAKEMEDHKQVSVSKIYVPNDYTVYLCSADRAQFEGYESSLLSELREYLAEHARREGYAVLSRPEVSMVTDDDLEVGEFGIATKMVQGAEPAADGDAGLPQAEPGATMIYKPAPVPPEAAAAAEPSVEREVVTLTANGTSHELDKLKAVIGRSKDCDIRLDDPNASRRHAEVRQEGTTYWLVDLGSTNGTVVNGRRQKRVKLESGDTITIGSTDLTFRRDPERQ